MFSLLFSSAVLANDALLSAAASALDRGQPRIAIQIVEKGLVEDPSNPDMNLLAGTAHARIGHYHDAHEFFEYSAGSKGENTKYREFNADVLRIKGHGDKAAEMRMGLIMVGDMPKGANIRLYTAIIDDYRSIGALHQAHDIHALMESDFPNGMLTHIMGAELAMDEGNLDQAFGYLSLIPEGQNIWRLSAVHARLSYLEKNYQDAYNLSFRLGRSRQPSMGVGIRLEAARMANDPMEAIHVLGRNTWLGHEAPEFLLGHVLSLADMGQTSEAVELSDYFYALYAENQAYLAEIDQVLHQIDAIQRN